MDLLKKSIRIAREDGIIELGRRFINFHSKFGSLYLLNYFAGKTYSRTIRRTLPEIGDFELNGVSVPGKKKFDGLTPNRFFCLPGDQPNYEHTEVEAVKRYVGADDDVVVIGGGYGVTAVHAAKNTSGEVTVIEADYDRYRNLTRTVEVNDVSEQINSVFGYIGKLHIDLDNRGIPLIPYQEIPVADVWDMDCEGAEIEILQNLPYKPSTILVETHDNHDTVFEMLNNLGYEVLEVVDDGIGQSPVCTHIRATAN